MATILRSLKYPRYIDVYRYIITHHQTKYNFIFSSTNSSHHFVRRNNTLAQSATFQENDNAMSNAVRTLDEQYKNMGVVKAYQIRNIIQEITKAGHIESLHALLVLRCCGDVLVDHMPHERIQLANELWDLLQSLNIRMDVSHYNTILQVHLENGLDFSPLEFLSEMQDKGIIPNKVTFERLIEYYCKKGNIADTGKILEYMREEGISLNENIFNSLILGHSEAGDLESAVNMLSMMQSADIQPSSNTYVALMNAYARVNDIANIKAVLEKCASKNIVLLNKDIYNVIYTLIINNHMEHVNEMLDIISARPMSKSDSTQFMSKLLNIGQVDLAFKTLMLLNPGHSSPYWNRVVFIFIRKLLLNKISTEKIIELCKSIDDTVRESRALAKATEVSYKMDNQALTLALIKAHKDAGLPVRIHYFWPLLARNGQNNNYQGVLNMLKHMINEFNITPCPITLRDYVLPYSFENVEEVQKTLQQYGIPDKIIHNGYVSFFFTTQRPHRAFEYMKSHPGKYCFTLLKGVYSKAISKINDFAIFLDASQCMYNNVIDPELYGVQQLESDTGEMDNNAPVPFNVQLYIILAQQPATSFLIDTINYLWEQRQHITPIIAQVIKEQLGDRCTPEMQDKLDVLRYKSRITHDSNEQVVGKWINTITNNRYDAVTQNECKKQLISYMCTFDSVSTLQEMLQLLSGKGIYLSARTYHKLFNTYCERKVLEVANFCLESFRKTYPSWYLEKEHLIQYVTLLLEEPSINDVADHLSKICSESSDINEKTRLYTNILHHLAMKKDAEKVKKLFGALVSEGSMIVTQAALRPLVRVHIQREDYKTALETWCFIANKYKITVVTRELLRAFIMKQDTTSIQTIVDLSIKMKGELLTLIELLFGFIECKRINEAKNLVQTHLMKYNFCEHRAVNAFLNRCSANRQEDCLEGFLDVISFISTPRRYEVYSTLLNIYTQKNDWKAGLNLWTRMQAENLLPPKTFLNSLAQLLKSNTQKIPFVYAEKKTSKTTDDKENLQEEQKIVV